MRSGATRAIARLYRLTTRSVPSGSDEPVEIRPGVVVPRFVLEWSRAAPAEIRTILACFQPALDVTGKSVATVGRGAGDVAIELARSGASRVVALDMAARRLELSKIALEEESGALPVEAFPYPEGLSAAGDRRFDVVVAVDAFRKYRAAPGARHVEERTAELAALLAPGGKLAVALGPSWKAPFGGGIQSRLPWAHLIFPEEVIFAEHRRARPGNRAQTFNDIGVNRITLERFLSAMSATGLACSHLETNVGDRRAVAVARQLSRIPALREHFAQNVFGVWVR